MPLPKTIVELRDFKVAVKAMKKLVILKYVDRFDVVVPTVETLLGKSAAKTATSFGKAAATRKTKPEKFAAISEKVAVMFSNVIEKIDVAILKVKAAEAAKVKAAQAVKAKKTSKTIKR
jgi:hypothetical protein